MVTLEGFMPLTWWAISVLALLMFISILVIILLNRRMKRFESSYITLQTFMSGKQMDIILQEYIHKVDKEEYTLEKLNQRLTLAEQKLRASVDRAELLRFKAFDHMGSDLSFAFALLNQEGSGVVLSSIHNGEESRIYAKPVREGVSSYTLTDEEKEVISKAQYGIKV